LALQELKEMLVHQVYKDPMDPEDQTEALDSPENAAKKEQPALQVPTVNQELLVDPVQKVTRGKWVDMVWLDLQENQEMEVISDRLAHKDKQDPKDVLEIRDQMDHQETQDQKDHLVTKGKLETKDLLDLQETTVFQEMLAHLDLQDHQDHLEIYQEFLPEVYGTDSTVAERDQDGIEANVQFLTIQKNKR